MFQIRFWYNKGQDDQNKLEHVEIRCNNCGKQNGVYMDDMNNKYKDIITSFVLNTVLHHVGISWIIETNKYLEYDMDKHNSDWIAGGPWYNTFICKKLHGKVFEEFIINAITEKYNLMYLIDAHEKQTIRT